VSNETDCAAQTCCGPLKGGTLESIDVVHPAREQLLPNEST